MRRGQKNAPHFKHEPSAAICSEETALHRAAKGLIRRFLSAAIQEVRPYSFAWDCAVCGKVHRGNLAHKAARVDEERTFRDIRPDLVVVGAGGGALCAIEVVVSHPPEPETRAFYEETRLAAVLYEPEGWEELSLLAQGIPGWLETIAVPCLNQADETETEDLTSKLEFLALPPAQRITPLPWMAEILEELTLSSIGPDALKRFGESGYYASPPFGLQDGIRLVGTQWLRGHYGAFWELKRKAAQIKVQFWPERGSEAAPRSYAVEEAYWTPRENGSGWRDAPYRLIAKASEQGKRAYATQVVKTGVDPLSRYTPPVVNPSCWVWFEEEPAGGLRLAKWKPDGSPPWFDAASAPAALRLALTLDENLILTDPIVVAKTRGKFSRPPGETYRRGIYELGEVAHWGTTLIRKAAQRDLDA